MTFGGWQPLTAGLNWIKWPWSGSRTRWTGFAPEPDPMFRFGLIHLVGLNLPGGPGSTGWADLEPCRVGARGESLSAERCVA